MIKLRLFWRWMVIIIWDHAKYHASKNPVKRKVVIPEPIPGDVQRVYDEAIAGANARSIYPPAGGIGGRGKTCHFCEERTTRTFIKAGNKKHPVYICEECVALCAMITLAEQKKNATKTNQTLPETYPAKGE